MKMAIAFILLVAGVTGAAAQMWTEDMSNGARSNPGGQSVQSGTTRNASPYGAANQGSTQRDISGRRGNTNPYARSTRGAADAPAPAGRPGYSTS